MSQPPVDVRLLRVGECTQLEKLARTDGRWRRIAFASYVALIGHPEHGWTLVDTGYSRHFFDATRRLPERLYRALLPVRLPDHEHLTTQLHELGVSPADIQRVVVTHFHGDHASGLRDFPTAHIVSSAAGLAQIRQLGRWEATTHGLLPGLLPDDLQSPASPRFVAAESIPAHERDGLLLRDLFGDSSVYLVDLPGHTPGHLGVLVTPLRGRQVLLAGDASWSTDAIVSNVVPPAAVLRRFDDPDQTRTTVSTLSRWATRGDLAIVPSHDDVAARAASNEWTAH